MAGNTFHLLYPACMYISMDRLSINQPWLLQPSKNRWVSTSKRIIMTSVNGSSDIPSPSLLQTGVVVTAKQLCTACSARSKDRLFIYNDKGRRGSAYQSVNSFYGVIFCAMNENFGAYICRSCKNSIHQYYSCKTKLYPCNKNCKAIGNSWYHWM